MKPLRLADVFIETMRQLVDVTDQSKINTAKVLTDYWFETKTIIMDEFELSEAKAHGRYIEALSAEIGASQADMYNCSRVGRNITRRGLHHTHPAVTFGHWLALMRNTSKEKGVVPLETIDERLKWFYEEFDKHGAPPSPRTIENNYRKNGADPEWQLLWKQMAKRAEAISNLKMEIKHTVIRIQITEIMDKIIQLNKTMTFD